MIAVIGAAIQLIFLIVKKWFEMNDERKAEAKEILKEVPSAKDVSSITRIFDRINSL
jgi:hypothetical protein